MKRISRSTFASKKLVPVVFVCFTFFFMATSLRFVSRGGSYLLFLIVPLVMLVSSAFGFRKLVWPLLDDVQDAGDHLLVRRGSDEDRIELADIMNVSVSAFSNPPRITLRLARPSTRFGKEVSFLPQTGIRLIPFSRIKVADDLIERVHRERSRRAG